MKTAELIAQAYAEDVPDGDLTTKHLNLTDRLGDARLVAKEDLVLSGADVFAAAIHHASPETNLRWQFKDGDFVLRGQTVCWLRGDFPQLLRAERVALNFLGHLSGIASLTRCFVQETRNTECKILDTRKTTPLLRALEKQAVVHGGGVNHRMSLSDAVLLKENHLRAAGSLTAAVRAVRTRYRGPVEVECATLEEVAAAVNENVQRILLDNMDNAQLRAARALIPATMEVEASGNMTLPRIAAVAATGVDFISVGALTHSAPCADFSLLFEWESQK